MKKIFILIVTAVVTASCTPYFYQVYKTTSPDQISIVENELVYEDQNVKISYNLWGENGNIGFSLFNKTDANIYLDLGESFFILNGFANNYYRNRTYTQSTSALQGSAVFPYSRYSLSTSAVSASRGYSTSFAEERIVCIPGYSRKHIAEYAINDAVLRYCDLLLYPTKNKITTKVFTKEKSPLVFSNRIAYFIDTAGEPVIIKNEFYVSEITNYPQKEMEVKVYEKFCGKKSKLAKTYLKDVSPEKFYIKYNQSVAIDSDY